MYNSCLISKHLRVSAVHWTCHSSPLAPDPIRVQSCVWCLFWTNRNSMAGIIYHSIYLIIQLEMNPFLCKWKYLLLLKPLWLYPWRYPFISSPIFSIWNDSPWKYLLKLKRLDEDDNHPFFIFVNSEFFLLPPPIP